MIKAVLFDLDGTLVDTQNLIITAFRSAAKEVMGVDVPSEEIRKLIGIPLETQMRKVAPDQVDEMMATYRAHNEILHDELIAYFEGTHEMLKALKAQGKQLAVVTSKRHAPANDALRSFDLQDYFEFVVGMDDCLEHKPLPGPLLLAAKRLGVDPSSECVYVGDSPYDMQAAVAAKMQAVGAIWGMFTREELLAGGMQHEAARPQDVLTIVDELDKRVGER